MSINSSCIQDDRQSRDSPGQSGFAWGGPQEGPQRVASSQGLQRASVRLERWTPKPREAA